MAERPERIYRQTTPEERASHAEVREAIIREFPPATEKQHGAATEGLAARLRESRKAQGLTYEAVARRAGLAEANTVKDVEFGRDTDLHHVEAIAQALGLKLELVAAK